MADVIISGAVPPGASIAVAVGSRSVVDFGAVADNATDASAAFQAAVSALSGTGIDLYVPAGTYLIGTPIDLSAGNITIRCAPEVIFHMAMSNTGAGGFTQSLFFASKTGVGTDNLLTADGAIGSHTIAVTSNVAAGAFIMIAIAASGNIQQQLTVLSTENGQSPGKTLTLDEELIGSYYTTGASAKVYVFTPPQNIYIYGNGARVYGTGDRVVEFAFARNCYAFNIYVDHRLGAVSSAGLKNIQFSCDIGCRECGFSMCRADGGDGYLTSPIGTAGFAIESSSRCYIRDSHAQGFRAGSGIGVAILGAKNCITENVTARNCIIGWDFTDNDAVGTEGPREVTAVGCTSTGCDIGWNFEKAGEVYCYNSSSIGDNITLVQTGAGVVFFHGCDAKAKVHGVYVFATTIQGDVYCSGKVDLSTSDGALNAIVLDLSAISTGTLHLNHFRTVGGNVSSGYGLYIESGGTAKIVIGSDVDLSSVNTPIGGTPSAATWTFYQAGYQSFSGNATLGWTTVGTLRFSAAATVNVPAIPHMAYDIDNKDSAGSAVIQPTGGSSVTVAAGKTARVKVNHAATAMLRMVADTTP